MLISELCNLLEIIESFFFPNTSEAYRGLTTLPVLIGKVDLDILDDLLVAAVQISKQRSIPVDDYKTKLLVVC